MDHTLAIRLCRLSEGRLVPKGDTITLTLTDAIRMLAPSAERPAKMNILRARSGNYIGLFSGKVPTNFLLSNPSGNDISWLLKKQPEIESKILAVYLVEDVTIPKYSQDLPPITAGQSKG